jgi:uncharacterized protein
MAAEPQRFLVDSMALRLGKYLRCLGYDVTWDVELGTRALARRAELEERIFLTRNTRLGTEIVPPPRCLVLLAEDPVAQLHEVTRALDLDTRTRLFTRCLRCNVPLAAASSTDVDARVPPAVRARHHEFFACPTCASIFWHGTHVANTCKRLA